ncbi:hypothetical protein ACFRAE_01130 [Sphingobacterium sp. HJSM2_6]|uniref:hypothetical protein n=1 Tax=Sphingobacterium sp. HJSM2_6 TaxID=3366264 RepID=UPI003BEC6FBA
MKPVTILYLWFLAPAYILSWSIGQGIPEQKYLKDSLLVDSSFTELLLPKAAGEISGADGCVSIDLGNNQSLFLWGDSFLGKIDQDIKIPPLKFILGNTATLLDQHGITQLYQGNLENPKALFDVQKKHGKEMWYWPGDGIIDHNQLLLFMSKYSKKAGETGPFAFQYEGCDLLLVDLKTFKIKKTIAFMPADQRIHFGHAVLKDGQDLYVYGSKMNEERLTSDLHVMKINMKPNAIKSKLFWDGTKWNSNPNQSQAILGIKKLVSEQFSIRKVANKIIFLTQDRLKVPGEIYSYLSMQPEGPFTEERLIYQIQEPNLERHKLFTYNAMLHPQIQKEDKILMSYNINSYDEAIWWKYGSAYRPRFLWVPKTSFGLN